MPRLSQPLLPADLIRKIRADDMMTSFETVVFGEDFHEARLMMRNWEAPHSPNSFLAVDPTIGFTAEMKRTTLHIAAYDGDVLAVYELLGLGTTADIADSSGVTPICLAISQLAIVTSPHALGFRPDGSPMSAADNEREASRLKCVIRILVEQHVALNTSMDGEPLINLLCRSKAWDIITLFLEHGAVPPTNATALRLFKTTRDRSRFASLLTGRVPNAPRPARKCPCWSGKIVSECHENAQPYPLAYLRVGKWDPTLKRIMHDYDNSGTSLMERTVLPKSRKMRQAARASGLEFEDDLPDLKMTPEMWQDMAGKLLGQDPGPIDPAFAYAFTRALFLPRPWGRRRSRVLCESEQQRWNKLVDEYICTQKDGRSKHSIERAAKIGTWHGALIRACEGPSCTKIEGPNGESFKHCSKCKMVLYLLRFLPRFGRYLSTVCLLQPCLPERCLESTQERVRHRRATRTVADFARYITRTLGTSEDSSYEALRGTSGHGYQCICKHVNW
ncbi:hypothetical protein DFH08DRAFT_1078177, partial [Mycena albidolilacea]